MQKMPRVSVQTADFNVAEEIAALRAQDGRVGAVCSFVGTVRDRTAGEPGAIQSMELEHYPGMTEKSIEDMIDAAHKRFDIFGARVIHRVGLLAPLDQIVMVAVTSAGRRNKHPRVRVGSMPVSATMRRWPNGA